MAAILCKPECVKITLYTTCVFRFFPLWIFEELSELGFAEYTETWQIGQSVSCAMYMIPQSEIPINVKTLNLRTPRRGIIRLKTM